LPALTIRGGKLYSSYSRGQPVYAGSYIRKREVILDCELRSRPNELARILTHELFHFAWVRLGNPVRRSYERLLRREFESRDGFQIKGEMWLQLARMAIDSVDGPSEDLVKWVRNAGFAQAWEKIPDRARL